MLPPPIYANAHTHTNKHTHTPLYSTLTPFSNFYIPYLLSSAAVFRTSLPYSAPLTTKLVSPTEEELVEYKEMLDELNRSSSVIFKYVEGAIDREIVYIEELLNKNGEQVKVEITDEDRINEEEEFNND